jgi:competence protein ComEA
VGEGAKWQLVAVVVAAGLAVWGGMRLLSGSAGEASGPVRVAGDAAHAPSARARAAGGLLVYVTGAVRRPGVYRVPERSRVVLGVRRAGGAMARADLTAVNLAAPLQDGQQVVVPRRVAGGSAALGGGAPAGAAAGAQVSLATATAEQLDELDGIGPTLAERIVEYRQSHGGFASIDELGQVDGIGEKRLEALRDALQP